jgi:hypothetical protein
LCLLIIKPALEEFSIILRQYLIAFLNLTEFKLERIDLVMEDLRKRSALVIQLEGWK